MKTKTNIRKNPMLFESVVTRFGLDKVCDEYYETLGFETLQEKDGLIADAFKLFGEVKRHLSPKYKIDDHPDLSAIYDTPAEKREELCKAYEKERNSKH